MTIAQAFNEIAVAQGGTAAKSGAITAAIDALNDALAGSDQQAAQTIEGAVRLLGSHIGGGSSVTVESLTATENKTYTAPAGKAYSPVTVNVAAPVGALVPFFVNSSQPAVNDETNAYGGYIVSVSVGESTVLYAYDGLTVSSGNIEDIAAGATVELAANSETAAFFECGIADGAFSSVQALDLAYTYDEDNVTITFTVPVVGDGKYLVLYFS